MTLFLRYFLCYGSILFVYISISGYRASNSQRRMILAYHGVDESNIPFPYTVKHRSDCRIANCRRSQAVKSNQYIDMALIRLLTCREDYVLEPQLATIVAPSIEITGKRLWCHPCVVALENEPENACYEPSGRQTKCGRCSKNKHKCEPDHTAPWMQSLSRNTARFPGVFDLVAILRDWVSMYYYFLIFLYSDTRRKPLYAIRMLLCSLLPWLGNLPNQAICHLCLLGLPHLQLSLPSHH